jgi:hypothetical protein
LFAALAIGALLAARNGATSLALTNLVRKDALSIAVARDYGLETGQDIVIMVCNIPVLF